MQDLLSTTLALEIPPQGTVSVYVELIRCGKQNYFQISPQLESMDSQWRELARNARAANPFLEPWCLKPALQYLVKNTVDLLVVWESKEREKMLMLVPLVEEQRFHHIPMRHLALWRHPYCYLCTPLISPLLPLDCWLPALARICEQIKPGKCVSHSWLNADRLLGINDAARDWSIHLDQQTKSRAGVRIEGSYADYLNNLRTKKRKDLQRSRRRLGELGDLAVTVVSSGSEKSQRLAAVDEFLLLENRGWKKAGKTAIACNRDHELYFRSMIDYGLQTGQLLILRMKLDNQPVALLVVLVSACGSCGYTMKIATDTRLQKYSLGSLIILEFTQQAFAIPDLCLLDSCAAENHPMINALWKHKITLDDLTLVKKHNWRNLLVASVRWLRSARKKPE